MKSNQLVKPAALASLAGVLALAQAARAAPASAPSTRPATQPAADEGLTARVLAVRIARELPEGFANNVYARNFAHAEFEPEVVQILLMVRNPHGTLVGADQKRLRIDAFGDDTGRDLRQTPGVQLRNTFYNTGGNLSADRTAALLVVMTDKAPAPDARRITLRGAAVLTVAAGERTAPPTTLPLKIGGSVGVGGATLTVTKLTPTGGDSGGLEVEAATDGPLYTPGPLTDVTATDADGRDLKLRLYGRAADRNPDRPIKLSFTLARRVPDAKLRFTYALLAEERTFPFVLEVDLGSATISPPATRPAAAGGG